MAEQMIIERLNKLNDIEIFGIKDKEFKKYGKVLNIDTSEIVSACEKIGIQQEGTSYEPSVSTLEQLDCAAELKEIALGGCAVQIGLCKGKNSLMNALEYHKSSEINIAATPLVLIMGLVYELDGNDFSAEKANAFYLEKGDAVEVFSTSMHFCPCQVSDNGFSCVVVLPEGTNTDLETAPKDKLLFKMNKWIICHENNTVLQDKGIYGGIRGTNFEIKY